MDKSEYKKFIEDWLKISNYDDETKSAIYKKFVAGYPGKKNEKLLKNYVETMDPNMYKDGGKMDNFIDGMEKIPPAFVNNSEIAKLCEDMQKIKFENYRDFTAFCADILTICEEKDNPKVGDMVEKMIWNLGRCEKK